MNTKNEPPRLVERESTAPWRRLESGDKTAQTSPRPIDLPAISVIIPVHNDAENLEHCLDALCNSLYRAFEIIVVDDASTDETPKVASRYGARVLRLKSRSGPAAARNLGAESAKHDYLFFVDADVAVRRETVGQVAAKFADSPDVEAFFGSYDAAPGAPNLVSQYRNLLHHYVHQIGNEEASTFWGGCGAIKRSVLVEVGGFDSGYGGATIEDIEFGTRLHQAGYRITLEKSIQVKHLKRWTLLSMIDCDVRKRGIPWTRLVLRQGQMPNDLNLRVDQRFSAFLAAAGIGFPALAVIDPVRIGIWLGAGGVCLATLVVLNHGFYSLVFKLKGPFFALAVLPLHVVYFLSGTAAFAIGSFTHLGHRLLRSKSDRE